MNAKLLIDAIMRQTTVLIAQLSTTAGVRAPLGDIANQVFLELSRELEAQGVSQRVAADMFGLALRGYQKRIRRLTESSTELDQTLWSAVVTHLQDRGSVSRRRLIEHFAKDDPADLASLMKDLVSSGLVHRSGSGDAIMYGITSERDLEVMVREQDLESVTSLAWLLVYRSGGITRQELVDRIPADEGLVLEAITNLLSSGRASEAEGTLSADTVFIAEGSGEGWEAAVFDHFQAMSNAIGAKLSLRHSGSPLAKQVGGSTLSFDVHEEHPLHEEVMELFGSTRSKANELWARVVEYDKAHPIPPHLKKRVSFYFGQSVLMPEGDDSSEPSGQDLGDA